MIHLYMTRLFCGRCIGAKQQWKWKNNCKGIMTDQARGNTIWTRMVIIDLGRDSSYCYLKCRVNRTQ